MTINLQSCAAIAPLERVLLGHPGAFAVAEVHNPHMEQSTGVLQQVDRARAIEQWQTLRDSYEAIGVATAALDPVEGLADLCFTANPSFVLPLPDGGREVWLARMRHASREPEVEQHRLFFAAAQEALRTMPEHVPHFEGCGDGLLHPGRFLLHAGVGPRSSPAAWDVLQQAHPALKILRYSLVDPRFYHLDTALVPVDEETALYVPEAFDAQGRAQVHEAFPRAHALPLEESLRFAGNAHCPDGQHVLLEASCTATCEELDRMGYTPIAVPTSEFRKSGGSVFCLKQAY